MMYKVVIEKPEGARLTIPIMCFGDDEARRRAAALAAAQGASAAMLSLGERLICRIGVGS